MSENWKARRERGSRWGVLFLIWSARLLGRRVARLILHPVSAYFLLAAPAARRASRDYLGRVLEHKPRWRDSYRHIYHFAAATLDRLYMFDATDGVLQITRHGYEAIDELKQRDQGALLILAHLGSFEVLRGAGTRAVGERLRVLMDRSMGAGINAVLETINPQISEHIIDTSQDDVSLMLKVQEALDDGDFVALMGDRTHAGERVTHCDFLGGQAAFPLTPWLLAGMTGVPVVLAFSLYRGGNHYELHFEVFSQQLALPRAQRHARAHEYAQAYADRLAHHVRKAPYNWFNFYDFWCD